MTDKMTNDNLELKLGNSEDSEIGFIQNVDVYYNGEKIVKDNGVVLVINCNDKPLLISINDKNDKRYINKNQAYVGDIFIKTEYQNQGLAKIIYQKIADELNVEIVKGGPISASAKKMWEKFGDKISPQRN